MPRHHAIGGRLPNHLARRLSQRKMGRILALSTHDVDGIRRLAKNLIAYMEYHSCKVSTENLVYTLGQRRSMLRYRFAVHGTTIEELKSKIENVQLGQVQKTNINNLAFVFTGQGAQWPRMGLQLAQHYPVFLSSLKASDEIIKGLGSQWTVFGKWPALLSSPAMI